MITGSLKERDTIVRMLRSSVASGERAAGSVPALVKDVCRAKCWRERVDEQTGEKWTCKTFLEFVTAPPLKGLGTTLDILKRLCAGDAEAEAALDEAVKKGGGRPAKVEAETFNNVQGLPAAPVGNTRARALRKLSTEAEASPAVRKVYKKVLAGEISPHRAMVECGFRKEPDPVSTAKAAWKKMTAAQRRAFLKFIKDSNDA